MGLERARGGKIGVILKSGRVWYSWYRLSWVALATTIFAWDHGIMEVPLGVVGDR